MAVTSAAGCIALLVAASAGASALAPAATWGKALPLPGLRTLNAGGEAQVNSVSCASAGNCAAGGFYKDGSSVRQAFVASERNGRWSPAREAPASGALNAGGHAEVTSVSCASAGNCLAGGFYADASQVHVQAFIVVEHNGGWEKAREVPGTATLNKGGDAVVTAVSCASAGNCVAGGYYSDAFSNDQAFLVSEVNGTWAKAIEVPGSATLNTGGWARVFSVSCSSPGNCVAGGFYLGVPVPNNFLAFVVSERNGVWRNAQELLGPADSIASGPLAVDVISCPRTGTCAAGGGYLDQSNSFQAFVASGQNDHWAHAIEVPGSAKLNTTGFASVNGVSCAAAGSCAAGGYYRDSSNHVQALVVTERKGRWGDAIEVPGSAKLNKGDAQVLAVSCGSAGNCAASGFYTDSSGRAEPFVVSEQNGSWGQAHRVVGPTSFGAGGQTTADTISCTLTGYCVAAGWYADRSGRIQGYVVSRT